MLSRLSPQVYIAAVMTDNRKIQFAHSPWVINALHWWFIAPINLDIFSSDAHPYLTVAADDPYLLTVVQWMQLYYSHMSFSPPQKASFCFPAFEGASWEKLGEVSYISNAERQYGILWEIWRFLKIEFRFYVNGDCVGLSQDSSKQK